jgi:hypothetical protein
MDVPQKEVSKEPPRIDRANKGAQQMSMHGALKYIYVRLTTCPN